MHQSRPFPANTETHMESSENQPDKNVTNTANTSSIHMNECGNDSKLSLQKVTEDLVGVIRTLQKQLQQIPKNKKPKENLPSDFMEPQKRSFFKNTMIPDNDTPNSARSTKGPSKDDNLNETVIDRSGNGNNKESNALKKSSKYSTAPSIHSTGSNRRFLKQINLSSADPLKIIKDEVHQAIRDHKTFTVCGQFTSVRKALLERGWVERLNITYRDELNSELKKLHTYTISELVNLLKNQELTSMCRSLIKSKLLGAHQVDFYWGTNDESFKRNPDKIKFTLINKLKRDIFSYTSKQGLCEAAKVSHWYHMPGVSKLNHPRSYSLGKNGEMTNFIDDFRTTAAISLMQWIVNVHQTKETKIVSTSGKIPSEVFEFALNECRKFIKRQTHEDIDVDLSKASDREWNQFLEYFYKTIHFSSHFKKDTKDEEKDLVRKATYILDKLQPTWPYLDMDGITNMWILKPTGGSRGRGIHICRTVNYILKIVKQNAGVRYIVQKYIERPLLIYNTKFDIRQWFLISNSSPLTIWIYRQCYLRFSSQTYNVRKLHEAIHLTNNSVQCKYKNNLTDAALPAYNMWDSFQFQNYLSNIGYSKMFESVIYPGMKESITAAVLLNQDKMVYRRNSFELYGADFILTENFQPWLLEINSNPALSASTPITAKLCPRVLEDVIKVIVDRGHNIKASTGDFELIYQEKLLKLPSNPLLELYGHPVKTDYFFSPPNEVVLKKPSNNRQVEDVKKAYLKAFGDDIKKTLQNLLEVIQEERSRRIMKHKMVGCSSFSLSKKRSSKIKQK